MVKGLKVTVHTDDLKLNHGTCFHGLVKRCHL